MVRDCTWHMEFSSTTLSKKFSCSSISIYFFEWKIQTSISIYDHYHCMQQEKANILLNLIHKQDQTRFFWAKCIWYRDSLHTLDSTVKELVSVKTCKKKAQTQRYNSILVVPPSLSQLSNVGQCRILTQWIPLHLPPHLLSTAATLPLTSESLHIWHTSLGHASLSHL